jgi:hypothetical protein
MKDMSKEQLIALLEEKIKHNIQEFNNYRSEGGTQHHNGIIKASAFTEVMNEFRDEYPMGSTYRKIIWDLIDREKMGFEKYGTTVDKANLEPQQWMQHAYEEALDFAVYLKVLMHNYEQRNN